MATRVQWQCQLLLCLAIVAGSIAASLWTLLSKKKNPRAAPPPHVDGGVTFGCTSTAAMWRSRWSGVHPAWLLALRATAAVAFAAVLLWDLRTYDASIMVYYTEYASETVPFFHQETFLPKHQWILLLEIVYFGVATLFSAYGCFMHTRIRSSEPASNERLLCNNRMEITDGRCLGRFMQILYQVCGGAIVLTDVVFWALIVPFMSSAHFSLDAVMGCMHSFNLVFLLAETALNSLDFPWFGIANFVLLTCSYVIIQWMAHVCGLTWWPYPFLNPTAPWAPLWYLSMALLHFPCYAVYWSIVRAKNWCLPASFQHLLT